MARRENINIVVTKKKLSGGERKKISKAAINAKKAKI